MFKTISFMSVILFTVCSYSDSSDLENILNGINYSKRYVSEHNIYFASRFDQSDVFAENVKNLSWLHKNILISKYQVAANFVCGFNIPLVTGYGLASSYPVLSNVLSKISAKSPYGYDYDREINGTGESQMLGILLSLPFDLVSMISDLRNLKLDDRVDDGIFGDNEYDTYFEHTRSALGPVSFYAKYLRSELTSCGFFLNRLEALQVVKKDTIILVSSDSDLEMNREALFRDFEK